MNDMLRLLLTLFLLATTSAGAQTLLDPAFGVRGQATIRAPLKPGSSDIANVVATDSTGAILFTQEGVQQWVHRRRPDGTQDSSFGEGGRRPAIGGNGSEAKVSVLVRSTAPDAPPGTMYALIRDSDDDCVVQRWLPDGSIDTGYGTNGSTVVGYSICGDLLEVAGDVLVVGRDTRIGQAGYVRRLDADGLPRPSFGANGTRTIDAPLLEEQPVRLARDGDRLLALFTVVTNGGRYRPMVARMGIDDGVLDGTWDGDGIWIAQDVVAFDEAWDVALDGQRVLVQSMMGARVRRLADDGVADAAYGGDSGCTAAANPVLPGHTAEPTAQLVVSGNRYLLPARLRDAPVTAAARNRVGLLALRSDACALDTGYGSGGFAVVDVPGLTDHDLSAVRASVDGARLLFTVDDTEYLPGNAYQYDALVVASGFDGLFQPIGTAQVLRGDGDVDVWSATGVSAHVAGDGYILGGLSRHRLGRDARTIAARIRADGRLDPSFGDGGHLVLEGEAETFSGRDSGALDATAAAVVLAMPAWRDGRCAAVVRRFDAAGHPAPGFGIAGEALVDTPGDWCPLPLAARIVAGGKTLVALGVPDAGGSNFEMRLVRLDATGAPDPTFGTGGFSVAIPGMRIEELLVTVAGGYRVIGRTSSGGGVTAAAIDEVGALDASFGTGGVAGARNISGGPLLPARGTALPTGELLVTVAAYGNEYDCYVWRLDGTGRWDMAFGNAGQATLSCAQDLAVVADGDGAFASRGAGSAGPTPILATRLLANGGVDTAFAAAGTVSAGDLLLHHPVGHAAAADVRGTLLVSRVASGWDVVRIRPANDERISLDGFE